MLSSMTGFGSASRESELGLFTVEIKGINHRFLDINFRLPGALTNLERKMQQLIAQQIERGRVEVSIRWYKKGEASASVEINLPLLERLYTDVMTLKQQLGAREPLSFGDFLGIPALYTEKPPEIDEKAVWKELKKAVNKALKTFIKTRREEGARLAEDLILHLKDLETRRGAVLDKKDIILEKYRSRLLEKIEEFNQTAKSPVDEHRLEAEVLLYADKSDISEELARLEAHLVSFRKKLESEGYEAVGRSLDFLCQEILREVNTIGSKARDTLISNEVLEMKNTVEKIREQVQNVE